MVEEGKREGMWRDACLKCLGEAFMDWRAKEKTHLKQTEGFRQRFRDEEEFGYHY